MPKTWVVVADSSRAKIYALESRVKPLREIEEMLHPEGRLRAQDEVTDRQGGIAGGHGQSDYTFESPTDVRYQESIRFARQISDKLESNRNSGTFDDLILVAPPAFLGILRQSLSAQTLKLVSKSVDKHLSAQSEATIRDNIL